MEVKVNREIRNYSETIYFGLTLRQFIFSVLSCLMAVFLFFQFRDKLNTEILSWICIIGASPFAALVFVNYNGMTAEKAIYAWFKSEVKMPKKLLFKNTNIYYSMMKSIIDKKHKEAKKQK